MTITFVHPSTIRGFSDDFAAHVRRHSVNPGTDYLCPVGTPVVAVRSGTVTNVWNAYGGSGGRFVEVTHSGGYLTQYLHLDAISVKKGQKVTTGQRIATSGSSANGKSRGGVGPHLHLSLKLNGHNIDFAALILQQTLNVKAGYKLSENAKNDSATIAAVKSFQKKYKLGVDGVAGAATWKVLDKLPIPKPPAPITPTAKQRQVLSTASVNRRKDPTTASAKTGSVAAKTIVTLTGWRHGQKVSTIDVWFTDGNGWMWAGGFTDSGTHDLSDLTPAPPVVIPDSVPPVIEPEPPVVVPDPVPPVVEPIPDETAPNWFVRFIRTIIDALTTWLTGK